MRNRSALSLLSLLILLLVFAAPNGGKANISYETATVSGTVLTSDGQVVPNVRVSARAVDTQGYIETWPDQDGNYTMTLPTGTYDIEARYEWQTVLGTSQLTLNAQDALVQDFTFYGGSIELAIEKDGGPAQWARVEYRETAPDSCAVADACDWEWEEPGVGTHCQCTLGERNYYCDPNWGCEWWDTRYFTTYTDATGQSSYLVPEGTYTATAFAAQEPGQWGNAKVGEASGTVVDQGTTDLGTIGYLTGTVGGAITTNGNPMPYVRVAARSEDGRSYFETQADGLGTYSFRLPDGAWDIIVRNDNWEELAIASVTVIAGQHVDTDFAIVANEGNITGWVTRDAEPSQWGRVEIREAAPESCAVADYCDWEWEEPDVGTHCQCTKDERNYYCDPNWGCEWWDTRYYSTYTDSSGSFDITVPATDYTVSLYAGQEPAQWGNLRVAETDVTVPAGGTADLGTTAYVTGFLAGAVTNCGNPAPNMRVYARATDGSGSVETYPDGTGNYSLRLPVAEYDVESRWDWQVVLGSLTTMITEGATASFSADGQNGQLTGSILRDGMPAVGARAEIRERAPESCAAADACDWEWEEPGVGTHCQCTVGGRNYYCDPNWGCEWWDAFYTSGYTGADGTFLVDLPAGDYDVDAYSAQEQGQHGQVLVGSVESTVNACGLSEIGASGSVVQPGNDVFVELSDGVTLDFSSVTDAGSVSYVSTSTPQGGDPPAETIEFLGLYYDFVIEAGFTGDVELCLPYDPDTIQGSPNSLKIYHWEDGKWHQLPTTADTVNNMICGITQSFSWYVVGFLHNQVPTADAGPALEVVADENCDGLVPLDGSGSADPDGVGDIIAYSWTVEGQSIASGATADVSMGLGTHHVELTVTDSAGQTHSDTVSVTVVDRTPPDFEPTLSPTQLWPPNGKMMEITSDWTVSDNCTAEPSVETINITSPTAGTEDMQLGEDGIFLRAERDGENLDGRSYYVHFSAWDDAGNTTDAQVEVLVPHDQGKGGPK